MIFTKTNESSLRMWYPFLSKKKWNEQLWAFGFLHFLISFHFIRFLCEFAMIWKRQIFPRWNAIHHCKLQNGKIAKWQMIRDRYDLHSISGSKYIPRREEVAASSSSLDPLAFFVSLSLLFLSWTRYFWCSRPRLVFAKVLGAFRFDERFRLKYSSIRWYFA